TDLTILLDAPGGIIEGTINNAEGMPLQSAIAALVPEAPYRTAGPLYRTVTSDVKGRFELRGIRPGAYRLYAWSDLEGPAYRNEEFMKAFEDMGKRIEI